MYMHIYIYVERARERERVKLALPFRSEYYHVATGCRGGFEVLEA